MQSNEDMLFISKVNWLCFDNRDYHTHATRQTPSKINDSIKKKKNFFFTFDELLIVHAFSCLKMLTFP